MPTTTDAFINSLPDLAAAQAKAIMTADNGTPAAVWLMFALALLSEGNGGLVISIATSPITSTDVLYVSDKVLSLLAYADRDAYAAALTGGTLINADDVAVTTQHVVNYDTAGYDIRMVKGDGSGSRTMRIHGATLSVGPTGATRALRWTVVEPRP